MDIYDKSLEILEKIVKSQKKYNYKIILLGGWAVWLYNPYMKSKDIDFIIEKRYLWRLSKFIEGIGFRETSKVLQKHGFSMMWGDDKIELDVYTEKISKWQIHDLINDSKEIKGISVLSPTKLFMLKAFTALERQGTAKGEKDFSDIIALLDAEYKNIDFDFVKKHVELKTIFNIIFSSFQVASRLYPIEMKNYRQIKKYVGM